MVTVSHLTKKAVEQNLFLEEAMVRGIINYAALAELLQQEIEKELDKEVKISAISMALRRLSEKQVKNNLFKASAALCKDMDISIKSDIFELTLLKSPSLIKKIQKFYELVDFSRGDFLTVTQGMYEVTILSSARYKNRFMKIIEDEKKVKIVDNLSALMVKVPMEALETEGLFYMFTKSLAWENINLIEIVSTLTELIFILKEDQIPKAYKVLQTTIKERKEK